uniref:Uncharacterized protein n=1 Tax=Siphoviridae sp. cty3u30 TaxID=2825744 RepID=A0A8S5Q8F1_9CAUD|nr:MAG TPA: hypothetical protein [Siphoviridae sp. cty3u30]
MQRGETSLYPAALSGAAETGRASFLAFADVAIQRATITVQE